MNNEPNDPYQPVAAPHFTEAAVLQRVAHLFRHAGADPTMQALQRELENFRLGQLP